MRNFQGIAFIWQQTYREILKTALVYYTFNALNYYSYKLYTVEDKIFVLTGRTGVAYDFSVITFVISWIVPLSYYCF